VPRTGPLPLGFGHARQQGPVQLDLSGVEARVVKGRDDARHLADLNNHRPQLEREDPTPCQQKSKQDPEPHASHLPLRESIFLFPVGMRQVQCTIEEFHRRVHLPVINGMIERQEQLISLLLNSRIERRLALVDAVR